MEWAATLHVPTGNGPSVVGFLLHATKNTAIVAAKSMIVFFIDN
jgi:hypothetical protein